MSKKSCFLSLICLLLFAVFIAGGCGGGSSHSSINSNSNPNSDEPEETQEETQTELPDIADIIESEEFQRVMQELEAELLSNDAAKEPNIHYIYIMSGDRAIIDDEDFTISAKKSQMVKTSATLPQEELERIAAKLKQPYESGDIIALAWPSAATIDDLYTALGEQSTYVDPYEELSNDLAPEDTYPEFYAIAKRYNGNAPHYFTYLLPGSKTILAHKIFGDDFASEEVSENYSGEDVSENSGEDDGSISDEYKGLRGAYIFQARRYAAFIRWAATIDAEMEKQKEYVQSSALIRSAADPSTNLFDYTAQRETANFDWYGADRSWYYWGKHSRSYSAQTSETIYAFHNFTDRKDYYVVRSSAYYAPDYAKKTENGNVYTVGSAEVFRYIHLLDNAGSYKLFSNAPKNVNRSSSVTDGTSHSTSDTLGVKTGMKIGLSGESLAGEFSAEMSASTTKSMGYSHSATWTTTEWSLTNECDSQVAKWVVDFYNPTLEYEYNPPRRVGYNCDYSSGNVETASRSRTDYDSEWMWQVSDPNPKIQMSVQLYSKQRATLRKSDKWRWETPYTITTKQRKIKLNQPPHVIITSGEGPHSLGRNGGNNMVFNVICSGNWKITSNQPDWCYVTDSQSKGGDTNAKEMPIMFFVEPFTEDSTKAKTREAVLTVTNTDTNQIQTVRIVQSNR